MENQKVQSNTKPTKDELIKKQLSDSINNGIKDAMTQRLVIKTVSGTLLNDKLIGRSKRTKNMYMVPKAFLYKKTPDSRYTPKLVWLKLAESRLTRFLESSTVIEVKKKVIPLKDGSVVNVEAEASHKELKGNPILFVDLLAEPTGDDPDPIEVEGYEMCKSYLLDGLKWKCHGREIRTEYCQSSASELRTLVGLSVDKDLKFTDEYLSKFVPENDTEAAKKELEEFLDTLRNLRGAEVIYTALSYGAYLKEYKGVDSAISKFMARMGMAQTSTKSLGNDFTVKHIGAIRIPFLEQIANAHRAMFASLTDAKGNRYYSDEKIDGIIKMISDLWKEEKTDGQNIIRASAVVRGFARLGIKLKESDVIGKLIQFRWAGVKGTALVVPDSWLDVATLPDGSHPYVGYDIIVEDSSWKYTPWTKWWHGEMAPELELVAISKSKSTSNMTFQAMTALDGNGNTVQAFKDIVTRQSNLIKDTFTIPEIAKAYNGIKTNTGEEASDDLEIDDYEKSMTKTTDRALDACDDIIFDYSYRLKGINRTTKMKDRMGYGKIPIEGKNRFIITDPTAFFRTDLAVPRMKNGKVQLDHEGNPMFDIVITSMDQLAIRDVDAVYWNDYSKPAVLFRSPCVHPGEPQKVKIVGLDTIPEKITTGYGDLNIRELFASCKDLVIVNALSYILDALGGADTDGDTVLIVTEPGIVELRSNKRLPMLISIDPGTLKAIITPDSIKKFMVSCLRDAGIGLITNYATTWRDIELMVANMPNPENGEYKLPGVVKEALEKMVKKAKDYLKKHKDTMSELDRKAAEATADICHINDNKYYNNNKETGELGWPRLVINACEANLQVTRFLQETAINTAKSGVFVNFALYPWIRLGIRATWHRPKHKVHYKSWSPMGQLHEFVNETWKELREWAKATAKPLVLGSDSEWEAHKSTYKVIKGLKASFGAEVYEINQLHNKMEDEEGLNAEDVDKARMNAHKDLAAYYNLALRTIAIEIGSMDLVSKMVYNTVIDRDKDNEEGLSFVWNCWGEEFVHTLKHLNSGKDSKKLVIIRMDKKYEDMTLSDGEYLVEDNKVRLLSAPEEVVAHCKVPDGFYEVITYNEKPYLLMDITRKSIDSLSASFRETKIRLVGMRWNQFEGKTITRDMAKNMLKEADYIVTITDGNVMKKDAAGVEHEYHINSLVYVNLPGYSEPVCIGNLPQKGGTEDESGFFAKALYEKVIRVTIPMNADSLDVDKKGQRNTLSLEIAEVVEDLLTK